MEVKNFKIFVLENNEQLGEVSAEHAGEILKKYTKDLNRSVLVVFAAAPSQDTFLDNLSKKKEIKWENVYAFHLDEYIDLPKGHPNTFQIYLKEHIFDRIEIPGENIFYMKEAGESEKEIIENYSKVFVEKYREVKKKGGIYLAFIGIGVNGHIAFNEPGTDLWTDKLIIKVTIDETSVKQQYHDYKNHPNPEARYKSLEEVPRNALTLTVSGILLSDKIFCMVPGKQKANAVKKLIEGPICESLPASFIRFHQDVSLYLDRGSSSQLKKKPEVKLI